MTVVGRPMRRIDIDLNKRKEKICETLEGVVSVIFQHEIDHLNGVLFTDRIALQTESEFIEASKKINLFFKEK